MDSTRDDRSGVSTINTEQHHEQQQQQEQPPTIHEPHPLWRAARSGNLRMAEEILRAGMDENIKEDEGRQPIHAEDLRGEGGQHPIHAAIESNNAAIIDLFLEAGLLFQDIDVRDDTGRTPLFYAALMGNLTLVQRLITNPSCQIDAVTLHGWRPLHAALGGINAGIPGLQEEVIIVLLDHGANPQKPTANGCTPLHYAACIGLESVVHRLVLQHSVDLGSVAINSRFPSRSLPTMEVPSKPNRQTPLHMALEGGHESVSLFLVSSASPKSLGKRGGREDEGGEEWGGEGGESESGRWTLDAPDSDGRTALWLAARAGFHQIVELLINSGADMNIQMSHSTRDKVVKGKTPLMAAIGAPRQTNGHKRVIEILLEKGALVNMENDNQMTALSLAVKHGYSDTCGKILEMTSTKAREVLTKERLGILLHSAIRYRHTQVMKLLLLHGADVEILDKEGRTPLHKAVMVAHTEGVRRLVRCGVQLDRKDDSGRTPLDIAVYGLGNTDLQKLTKPWVRPWSIIVLLVQAGADLNHVHQKLFSRVLESRRELDELEPENPRIQLADSDFAEQKKNRPVEEIFCWCLEWNQTCRPLKVMARNQVRRTLGRRLETVRGASDLNLPEFIYHYLVLESDNVIFDVVL